MTDKTDILKTYAMPNVGCLIGTAYQRELARLANDLADAGLDMTTTEYLVLRALYTRDGMQQCEISDLISKDKAAVCRCVTAMVRKGLVTTEAVSHKCLKVHLSPAGREIEPTVLSVADKRHKAFAAIASPKEIETFVSVLNKMIHQ
ncbi:MAG: MarR family winged helix-turn-helix transcriptional regulator [Muribaculaceae bacterium]|nr:MarR family winged helix-turn-helix transcriptional regulator [Muribaculaceae bacterium]